jgi:hypothetical protein
VQKFAGFRTSVAAGIAALSLAFSGIAPAQAAQVQPTTPTAVVHTNPSVLGVGANFELTAAVWPGSPTVTFNWQYKVGSCSPGGLMTFFSLTENGTPIDGFSESSATFTVPATIYVQDGNPFELVNGAPKPYNVPLSTDGVVFVGVSGFSGANPQDDYGSSGANFYLVGTGFCPTQGSNPPQQESAPAPYTGPVLEAPGALKTFATGTKLAIAGSNLSGVSKITISGLDAKVKVNAANELEITVPAGLVSGTYDLVVTSDSGSLTVQDGIRVSGSATVLGSEARPSTKLKEDNTVKVHVFDVVGAGKLQIFVNGEEIAWVNATDANDSKLLNGYLVRTVELAEGKNVIEVFVGGERVDRKAYTR